MTEETLTDSIVVRALRPRDVESLCRLLAASFEQEYAEQGLDVLGFRSHFRILAWANIILAPLRIEFFQTFVAVEGERVTGTISSFRTDRGRWYQGFGAVDPAARGKGLFKRLGRRSLEEVAARGGRVAGAEIRIDNPGSLRPWREGFGCAVLPAVKLYMVQPSRQAIHDPVIPQPWRPIGGAELDGFAEAVAIRRQFRGGFLLERELSRTLTGAICRWLLPPLTARSFALVEDGRLLAFARVRTHWPARIRALDAVYIAPEVPTGRAKDALLTLLAGLRSRTRLAIRVYVGEEDTRLESLCNELGMRLLSTVYLIRTEVGRALARTDRHGRLLPGVPVGTGKEVQ